MRVILADDGVVIREGLARLLIEAGIEIIAQVGDADTLREAVRADPPDVALVDIRMPPTFTDDGLRAAQQIRAEQPTVAVLLLSQYVDVVYALKLVREGRGGIGYLLKDRIVDPPALIAAMHRVAAGELVIEPALVEELVDAPSSTTRSRR